jgi:hypothetical protein
VNLRTFERTADGGWRLTSDDLRHLADKLDAGWRDVTVTPFPCDDVESLTHHIEVRGEVLWVTSTSRTGKLP